MEAEWLAMTEIDYIGRKEPGEPKGWKDYHRSEGSNCPSVHTDRTGNSQRIKRRLPVLPLVRVRLLPGLEMTGQTTAAKTNRECPKDGKTTTRLTSRKSQPGHPGQLHRNLIFMHFFSSQIPGKIMSNDSIYLFHFFLSYFLVAKTEAERPRFLHFPETSRPSAKSSKIIQNPPIDFFSTQWYSVLSTQRD